MWEGSCLGLEKRCSVKNSIDKRPDTQLHFFPRCVIPCGAFDDLSLPTTASPGELESIGDFLKKVLPEQ